MLSGLVLSDVYHITPLPIIDPCPVELCFTLSQINSTNYLNATNKTIVFQPGNHSLKSQFFFANGHTYCLHACKLHFALSSDSVITCHQDARFEFAGVRSVYVSGLKFIGCAGNRVESVNEFILEDSSFVGQEDIIGRALELVDTSANIVRSSFNYNKGDNVHHAKCTCLGRSSRRVDVVPIDSAVKRVEEN